MPYSFTCTALSFSMTPQQATTTWTGMADTKWNNPDNWSAGPPIKGSTAIIPKAPKGARFPVYNDGVVIHFNIRNFGIIVFSKLVYNAGTIMNLNNGQLINYDYFINTGTISLESGCLTNYGTCENYGYIHHNNTDKQLIHHQGSILNNYGQMESFQELATA